MVAFKTIFVFWLLFYLMGGIFVGLFMIASGLVALIGLKIHERKIIKDKVMAYGKNSQ